MTTLPGLNRARKGTPSLTTEQAAFYTDLSARRMQALRGRRGPAVPPPQPLRALPYRRSRRLVPCVRFAARTGTTSCARRARFRSGLVGIPPAELRCLLRGPGIAQMVQALNPTGFAPGHGEELHGPDQGGSRSAMGMALLPVHRRLCLRMGRPAAGDELRAVLCPRRGAEQCRGLKRKSDPLARIRPAAVALERGSAE